MNTKFKIFYLSQHLQNKNYFQQQLPDFLCFKNHDGKKDFFAQVFCTSFNGNTNGAKYRLSRDKSSGLGKLANNTSDLNKRIYCYCVVDYFLATVNLLAKVHELKLQVALQSVTGLLLIFTIVKLKGPNKKHFEIKKKILLLNQKNKHKICLISIMFSIINCNCKFIAEKS